MLYESISVLTNRNEIDPRADLKYVSHLITNWYSHPKNTNSEEHYKSFAVTVPLFDFVMKENHLLISGNMFSANEAHTAIIAESLTCVV